MIGSEPFRKLHGQTKGEGPIPRNGLWADLCIPLRRKQKDLKMTKNGIK